MRTRQATVMLVPLAAAFVLAVAGNAAAQKGGKCTDVSLSVQILAFDGDGNGSNDSVLAGDAKGNTYTNGADGVYNTVIHTCSGSNDATMGLITSRRSIQFSFPEPNAGSVSPGPEPAWVGSAFLAKPFMNVRNILWGRLNGYNTFTTRMGFSQFKGPGDKASYALQFAPDATDSGAPGNADANQPEMTSPATVQDIPGDCRSGGTIPDKWIVTVGLPAVGALMRDQNNGASAQSGQYTMPFQVLITARGCLPF